MVVHSSAEAEYKALAFGLCELIWLRRVLEEIGVIKRGPIKLYCDIIVHNLVYHDGTKHMKVDKHFIKEKIESLVVCKISTKQQVSDVLTKGLHISDFEALVDKLGLFSIYSPTVGEVLETGKFSNSKFVFYSYLYYLVIPLSNFSCIGVVIG